MTTFVKSTTAALASSCVPLGRQCMSDTITHVIPAVVPTHRRPSRPIASSRRRWSSPSRCGPIANVAKRRTDGAPTTSHSHQSLRPKSSQPAHRLTTARQPFAIMIANANGAASRRASRPADRSFASSTPPVFAVRATRPIRDGRSPTPRTIARWSSAHSAGAASRCRASSSAAAISAGSARRRPTSARGLPPTRRSGCSTPRGTWASRRSTPPTPTVSAAARSTSANGSGRRRPRCATASSSRPRRSTRWPRAPTTASARARIRRQVETSLGRLGVERIPLYLAHDFDPDVPQEETLGAFDELVRRGTVGAVGASNFTAEQLAEALELSALEGLTRYEWVQNGFSLLEQGDRETMFPLCHEHGLGYTPFSPLAGGWLDRQVSSRRAAARRVADDAAARGQRALLGRCDLRRARGVRGRGGGTRRVDGRARGRWLLHVPEITAVVVGPSRLGQLAPVARGARRHADRRRARRAGEDPSDERAGAR